MKVTLGAFEPRDGVAQHCAAFGAARLYQARYEVVFVHPPSLTPLHPRIVHLWITPEPPRLR